MSFWNRSKKTGRKHFTVNSPAVRRETSFIPPLAPLIRRETEIVQLLRRGCSNKEIARQLGITVATVKWNVTNILDKFHVESSRQLIALLSQTEGNEMRYWVIGK